MKTAYLPVVALLILVAACSSPGGGSRYGDAGDGAPTHTLRAEDVADAVPRPDPILAAGNASPYSVNGKSYHILSDYRHYRERGTASWYGTRFHGHKTANGEIFDLYAASAAHKTLPIPCYARVTNLANGRSIVVRVNDRGPFHGDRLIDLSYGAALKLGFAQHGTAPVEVEVVDVAGIDDRRQAANGNYRYLQLGAFSSRDSARRLRARSQDVLAQPVVVSTVESDGGMLYRVRVGPLADNETLKAVQQQLRAAGLDSGQPLP